MIKPDLLIGEVIRFDSENWTIDLKLNIGASVEDVTIKSVLNGEASGIFIEPVMGSYVLCGLTDGKIENLTALVFSEIKNIKLVPTEKLVFRNENFGGLVKIKELEDNLKSLKTYVEALKTATSSGINAIGVGPAANGGTGKIAFETAMVGKVINLKEMENKNVQHG